MYVHVTLTQTSGTVSLTLSGPTGYSDQSQKIDPTTAEYGEFGKEVLLEARENVGHTFLGWYNEEDVKVSGEATYDYTFTMPSESIVYKAKWIKCPVVLAKNYEDVGNVSGVERTVIGAVTTISAETVNPFYDFIGWYNGDMLLTDELSYSFTMSDVPVTYTAKWQPKETTSDEDFTFEEIEGGYALVRYNGNDSIVIIPSIYNGKKVAFIDKLAFQNNTTITSVYIPDSVTSIGAGAFSGCSSLENITIPFVGADAGKTSSDTYQYPFGYIFGTSSYTGGTAVWQHYYGSSTSSITVSTYYIPSSLRSVTVTGGNIPYGAFHNCSMLTFITIPDSVTYIGYYAFSGCSGLTSITIPDSVTSIESWAFSGCTGLTSVTFEGTVAEWKAIGKGVSWNFNCPFTEVVCSDGAVQV